MDLNASPLPEDDDQTYEGPVDADFSQDEHIESPVEIIMRREREERQRKLKRDQPDDGPRPRPQQIRNDQMNQNKIGGYRRIKETPQGWLDCPASGQPIDKIIPSKVPLDETFNESVLRGKIYSSEQVVKKQWKANRKIGLVIDLTNTSRYHLPSEWTKQDIKHVKIACRGRDAVPEMNLLTRLYMRCWHFMSAKSHQGIPSMFLFTVLMGIIAPVL